MRIFLVGFMGVGKTSIGQELAAQLGYRFVDTDVLIEEHAGSSITRIFETKGEPYFRNLEFTTMKSLLNQEDIVVSTGGGLACHSDLMKMMNAHGGSIHIRMYRRELLKRLFKVKSTRPLISSMGKYELTQFVERLYRKRRSFYNMAGFSVYNNSDVQTVTKRIMRKLGQVPTLTNNN